MKTKQLFYGIMATMAGGAFVALLSASIVEKFAIEDMTQLFIRFGTGGSFVTCLLFLIDYIKESK